VPLDRLILLIDGTTEFPVLRRTLLTLWPSMSAASPNARDAPATLRLVEVAGSRAAGVGRLLARCDQVIATGSLAARTPDGAAVPAPRAATG
jgi:hypothetical protein